MSNETRINLQHLLEDIRDSYSSTLEEVIVTELVANALDSGATRIEFLVNAESKTLRCSDNGSGMRRKELKEYHNIASSNKSRGAGIGFAGIGAKLSLLVAEKVVTETKGARGSRAASEWRLTGAYRAPWKYLPFSNSILTPRGSSVTIHLKQENSHLLRSEKITAAIVKDFYPLLHEKIKTNILKKIYRKGMEFFVNGQKVNLEEKDQGGAEQWFYVFLGKERRPVGGGYLALRETAPGWLGKITGSSPAVSILQPGLTISTYGKVIKSGWEWIGITPKNAGRLVGIAEIPAMAELLTTNKDNFLSDTGSLKKYYRFRKAIQEAILPILRQLGEADDKPSMETQSSLKPLARQIEDTLSDLAQEFPELRTVVGIRHKVSPVSRAEDGADKPDKDKTPSIDSVEKKEAKKKEVDISSSQAREKEDRYKIDEEGAIKRPIKKPGLQIALAELESEDGIAPLGRLTEDTVSINTNHPAWAEALARGWEGYHIALTIALILSEYAESERGPQEFVSKFLAALSKQMKPRTLF